MDINIFKKLGFSDKITKIYLVLLSLGPASVRDLSKKTEINRGTIYEGLKWLKERGLVNYFEEDTKQYFVAEDPDKLQDLVTRQSEELIEAKNKLAAVIPELKSVHDRGGERPVARYYGHHEIMGILEDVLKICEASNEKIYRIYSVAGIREYIYEGFESFSDARVAKGIKVRAIAIGAGGELRGLDERKWIKTSAGTPTYIIIYPGKTAYISLDAKDEPVGVVIENLGVYETQKLIFDELWGKL